jgi:hypothetical protein
LAAISEQAGATDEHPLDKKQPAGRVAAEPAALPRWLHLYDDHRPHAALAGRPPITRLAMSNLLGSDS